mgnify:CR=1 FL=1
MGPPARNSNDTSQIAFADDDNKLEFEEGEIN